MTSAVQAHSSNVEYTPWLKSRQSHHVSVMALRTTLALNLRRLRSAAGLSQEELADRAGIDRTYVSALERERYAATIDMIERLAAALRVKPLDLLIDAATSAGE